MIRPLTAAAIAATTPLTGPALAGDGPFIEITIHAHAFDANPEGARAMLRLVFDAGAAPDGFAGDQPYFFSVEGELTVAPDDDPFLEQYWTTIVGVSALSSAALSYNPPAGEITINATGLVSSGHGFVDAMVGIRVGDAFPDLLESLPDDPEDFLGADRVTCHMASSQANVAASWTPAGGFSNGSVSVRARVVERPEEPAPGCSIADLAAPFGVLNFDDALAFLSAFAAGCP